MMSVDECILYICFETDDCNSSAFAETRLGEGKSIDLFTVRVCAIFTLIL